MSGNKHLAVPGQSRGIKGGYRRLPEPASEASPTGNRVPSATRTETDRV